MARLVLHIGTHKTGTTSLQDQLFRCRVELAKQGFIYPDLSPHTGHHGYLTDWIHLPAAYDLPQGGRGALQHLADRYRDTDQSIFLTSEEFSRAGGAGGAVDFTELRKIFQGFDVQLICVLRDQLSFLQSVYLELSRRTLPKRPPEFLKEAMQSRQIDGLWCDYAGLYDQLRVGFAADEICLIDYASAKSSPEGIVAAVLSKVVPHIQHTESQDEVWSNRSPPVLPLWAAQVVAGWTVPGDALRQCAWDAFDLEFGPDAPQSLFTQAEITAAQSRFAGWNAAFETQLRQDGNPFVLTRPAPRPDAITRGDLTQSYWIRIARRLSFHLQERAA